MKKYIYIISCNIFLIIFIMAASFRLQAACTPVGGHLIIKNKSGQGITVSYSLNKTKKKIDKETKKRTKETQFDYKRFTVENNGSQSLCWRQDLKKLNKLKKLKTRRLSINLMTFVTDDEKSKLKCSVHVKNETTSISGSLTCTGQATGQETLMLTATNCAGPYASPQTICEVTVRKANQPSWPFKDMGSLF